MGSNSASFPQKIIFLSSKYSTKAKEDNIYSNWKEVYSSFHRFKFLRVKKVEQNKKYSEKSRLMAKKQSRAMKLLFKSQLILFEIFFAHFLRLN